MDWVTALCTSTGCTVDGAAVTLNPLSDWIENWTLHNLGQVMNINTPQNAARVVNAMSQFSSRFSLNSEEQMVITTLQNSLNVMEETWSQAQASVKPQTNMEEVWKDSQKKGKKLTDNELKGIIKKVKNTRLYKNRPENRAFQIESAIWRAAVKKMSKGYSKTYEEKFNLEGIEDATLEDLPIYIKIASGNLNPEEVGLYDYPSNYSSETVLKVLHDLKEAGYSPPVINKYRKDSRL